MTEMIGANWNLVNNIPNETQLTPFRKWFRSLQLANWNHFDYDDDSILPSELDSLFEPFNVEEISDENYEPFLDQKSGFTPSSSRRSSAKLEYVLIYSVLKNK
jgi:hypothetical protein